MFNTKKRNERVEQLNNAGVDTTKYFEFKVNEDIPKGSTLRIVVEDDEIKNQILNEGHIKVDGLYRRWVMAQYLKMVNYENGGYHGYMNNCMSYDYTIKTTLDEVEVLAKLEKKGVNEFKKRSSFFTIKRVKEIFKDYAIKLCKEINCDEYGYGIKIKSTDDIKYSSFNLNGKNYARVGNYYVICDEKEYNEDRYCKHTKIVAADKNKYTHSIRVIFDNLVDILYNIRDLLLLDTSSYEKIYFEHIKFIKRNGFISLPFYTKKSNDWIESFKRNGVYYTLQNMIEYHNIKFEDDEYSFSGMELLNWFTFEYNIETYKLHGKLIELLDNNNFDLRESIKENSNK